MGKKNSRATKNLSTSYFTVKRRRHAVPLSSKQVPMKIESVRKHRSKWAAEIKHPKKKNVQIWLGSYATQEEASKVLEHQEIKIHKDLVDDQEVVGLSFDCDFNAEKTGRYSVPLPSKKQLVPIIKIEGVRMKRSRWIAEIKHPKKKNVRIWLGSYATQEEASKVYQSKKMEHEKLKLQAIAEKDKLFADQEVFSAPNAEFLSDDPDVMMKVFDFDNAKMVNVLKESNAESQSDDRDVTMNIVDSDDQAKRSLNRRIVEQQAGDMLLELGPILVDRYGHLLGEFCWMDDLSIV